MFLTRNTDDRSPDNAKFASSGGDRTAFVWDVAAGTTIRRFSGHMARVNVVEFNPDASVLASGSLFLFVPDFRDAYGLVS